MSIVSLSMSIVSLSMSKADNILSLHRLRQAQLDNFLNYTTTLKYCKASFV